MYGSHAYACLTSSSARLLYTYGAYQNVDAGLDGFQL